MRALVAVLLVALLALVSGCQPDPGPGLPGQVAVDGEARFAPASFTAAPGDTLRYTVSWTPGARATGYLVTTTATGTGWSGMLTALPTTTLSVPFTPVNTTAWDSVAFSACVTSTAGGKVSAARCAVWKLVRSPGPPGTVTVDSSLVIAAIVARPKSASLAVSTTLQFCGYVRTLAGTVKIVAGYDTVLACQQHYDTMAGRLPGYPVAVEMRRLPWVPVTYDAPTLYVAHR